MTKALRELLARAEKWPEEVQETAVETLRVIEQGHIGGYRLTEDDLAALARSAEDVRYKRFASPKKIKAFFKRFGA